MLKVEKEYMREYGDTPKEYLNRVDYLLCNMKLNNQKKSVFEEIHRIINIKWRTLSYTIYLLPKATPRPRSGRNNIFYVKGAKDNKKIFEEFMKDQDISLIKTPTKFECRSFFPIPKSMSNIEKICAEMGFVRPVSKPDWDNIAKAYCDMIQGFLIYDDSLIIEGISKKYYSVKPRIEITISYMEDFDSKFNMKKIKKG